MGKKRQDEEVTEKIRVEDLYEEADAGEWEDPEKTEKLDLSDEDSESKREAKAKAPKKKDADSDVEADAKAEPAKPKKKRAARKRRASDRNEKLHADSMRADVSIASAAMHKSMESMVKQWDSMKEISTAITDNFDKVSQSLKEMPKQYESAVKDAVKATPLLPRKTLSHKLSIGLSVLAIILSAISIGLAQNARKTVYQDNLVTREAIESAKELSEGRRALKNKAIATRLEKPKKAKKVKKKRSSRTKQRGSRSRSRR